MPNDPIEPRDVSPGEPSAAPSPAPALSIGEKPGDRIGSYKLISVLGEGGFGVVFLAEQTEPIRRRVALKIIKPGMDSRQVLARFEVERQALALMDHPNVARVLDAGATALGRPFFVMEYVPGEPITAYCDRQRLTIRRRLELFIDVCAAVQHAHQKGIIHRDITPSNILIEVNEKGEPVVKVIDFGVAKAISQRLTQQTIYTEQGQLIGTPEYMSPEQAEMSALDVDTRSDVYSLGVVLYELLSGALPFDSGVLRGMSFSEVQRMIRTKDPPRPSARVSALSELVREEVARRRLVRVGDLVRILRRELEWIPLRAMRKDRTDRYQTAEKLRDDIGHYLSGNALIAGPESAGYRLRKFVRRNRGPVPAAAAVVLVLAAGVVGTGVGLARASRKRAAAEAARADAEAARTSESARRAEAEAISTFMQTVLQSSDPFRSGRQQMLVTDAMMRAVRQLDEGAFTAQPEVEASLRLTIAGILNSNGRSAEALPIAERALQISRQRHAGDHADVAAALNAVAECLELLGRSEEALPRFEAALEMRQRLFHGDHPEVAQGLSHASYCLNSLGRSAEALPKLEAALQMYQRLFKGDHSDIAKSFNNVALCLRSLGRSEEALPWHEAALAMQRRLFRGDHPDVAISLNDMALCLQSLDRSEQALPLFEASLDMSQRLFKGDHPDLAVGLNNVAFCLGSLGRFDKALPRHEAALEMSMRLFKDHPSVAVGLNNVAYCLNSLGRPDESLPKLEAALEMYQRLFTGDHPDVASGLNAVASCLGALNRYEEALPRFEASHGMYERLFNGDHPQTANVKANLARCLSMLDRVPEADEVARQAQAMAARCLPEAHPIRKKCDAALAEIQSKMEVREAGVSFPDR